MLRKSATPFVLELSGFMKKKSCSAVFPVQQNLALQGICHVYCLCPAIVSEYLSFSVQASALTLCLLGVGLDLCDVSETQVGQL